MAFRPHQQGTDGCDFIRRAGPSSHTALDHALVIRAVRSLQLPPRQRRDDDSRADRVQPRSTPGPANSLGLDSQRSTRKISFGGAGEGGTPAAWITPEMSPGRTAS